MYLFLLLFLCTFAKKIKDNQYGLYQQLYCGCEFSYAGGLERAKKLGLKDLYHAIDGPSKSPETK